MQIWYEYTYISILAKRWFSFHHICTYNTLLCVQYFTIILILTVTWITRKGQLYSVRSRSVLGIKIVVSVQNAVDRPVNTITAWSWHKSHKINDKYDQVTVVTARNTPSQVITLNLWHKLHYNWTTLVVNWSYIGRTLVTLSYIVMTLVLHHGYINTPHYNYIGDTLNYIW